jgi:threonine/homoserine/homoserine lactone efflux protein
MQFFYAFILSSIISFVGSLQPGPVNIAVISASIQKQFKNALLIAIGGSLPEFLFCFIAFKAANFIDIWHQYFFYFQIIIATLLFIVGVYLWFNKTNITLKTTQQNGFLLGTILAVLNPQLILFWTTVITYIHVNNLFELNLFETNFTLFYFCAGATFGAFSLHYLLIFLSKIFVNIQVKLFFSYADKTIAIIFVFLAIMQTVKLFH